MRKAISSILNRRVLLLLTVLVFGFTAGAFAIEGGSLVGVININTATQEQLMIIPDMTPEVAQNIIDYRMVNGPFWDEEELLQVSGVNEELLDTMTRYMTFTGETTLYMWD